MSTSANKLLALCLAAVLSMVLYGCSGGSSEQPDPGPTPAEVQEAADLKAAQDAAAAAEMAAMTAYKAAQAAFMGAEADKDADNTSYVAAEAAMHRAAAAYDDAKAANAAAQSAGTSSEAEAAQANAEAAQARAEAAQMDTEGYAAAIAQAKQDQEQEATALSAAKMAAEAAEMAAKTAYEAAKQAVMGIEADKAADMDSYNAAVAARERAGAAYRDAVRWNSSAQAATTSAAAEQAQRTAEGARDAAQAASEDASTEAGMVADAKMKADETMALNAAKTAANEAATAAETAYNEAKAAVDNAMADATSNALKYAEATRALDKAEAAYMAAMAANTKAQAAATSADAKMYQGQVEAARDDAMSYGEVAENAAGAVTGSGDDERMALDDAKKKARAAEDAAKKAYDDAVAAVDEVEDDDSEAYKNALAARDAARAAHKAAQMANTMAQAATDSSVAMIYQRDAENAKMDADNAFDDAKMYADMVTEAKGVADAQANATKYAKMARDHADDARAAANAVKAARGEGSAEYDSANEAAETAETAADDAEGARDAAMVDGISAENAAMYATEAMKKASAADTAKIAAEGVEATASRIALRDARMAASEAYGEAMGHYNSAKSKAEDARAEANKAAASLTKAQAARTDVANAQNYKDMADTAASNAEQAATDAHTAMTDAMNASSAAAATDDLDEAKKQQGLAEDANKTATEKHTGAMGAGQEYMAAKDAAGKAAMAADTHVIALFKAANGDHVTDLDSTPRINEKAVHVASVGGAMATTAKATDGAQAGQSTISASWRGDRVDVPGTTEDEFSEGKLTITVNPTGADPIDFELRASRKAQDLNGDGDMTDSGETGIIQTARMLGDLGVFAGYEIWEDDGDATTNPDGASAIVFTNKEKGKDSVLEVSAASAAARYVTSQDVAAGELSNVRGSGKTITGVTWTPSGERPLTGTLTCNEPCAILPGDDGAVTSISGYKFAGSRGATKVAAAATATENNDYLAFGLWLDESADGNTDTFGAFASGGTDYAVNVQQAVTGTATYSGNAAGAHHKTGEGVNWFHGDAKLMAQFGSATVPGTISGSIDNIQVNGGEMMSTPIYLGQADLNDGQATFNGDAFMGRATAPGALTHEFDGTWSGSFFGATDDVAATTGVDESVTAPLATAGTFGVTKEMGTGNDRVVESYVGAFGAHKE